MFYVIFYAVKQFIMTEKINIDKIITYWLKTADHDFDTMLGLYKIKRYSDCLFFGHIILEKILKAHIVATTKEHAPRLHDLVRLSVLAKINLTKEQKFFLKEVNDFNLATRYPDFKFDFYKKCTQKFAKEYLDEITKIYFELCQRLKLKK